MSKKQGKLIMDLDAIMDFIFAPDEKRVSDVEIEETFIPDDSEDAAPSSMLLAQRIKHEAKSGEHTQHEAIRVNFITRLLDEVDELDTDNLEMDLGEELAYNTLFHYGFLRQV